MITANRLNMKLANIGNRKLQYSPSPTGNVTKFQAKVIRTLESLPNSDVSHQVYDSLQAILLKGDEIVKKE